MTKKYTSARLVFHDVYSLADRSAGSHEFFDPTKTRNTVFSEAASRIPVVTETKSKKPGTLTDPERYESFVLVKAHRIIREMGETHRAWGMYAYTHKPSLSNHRNVQEYVFGEWWKANGKQFNGDYTKTLRHVALVHCAIEDMKLRLCAHQGKAKAEMAHLLGVDRQNWDRDWADRMYSMQGIIDELDKQTLAPIARMLNEQEQHHEDCA